VPPTTTTTRADARAARQGTRSALTPLRGWGAQAPTLAALAPPLAILAAGAALLGDWIIDDAGISYAYARNLAGGHGLVSQPGRPPVEGFSNFLWVVALAPLFYLRLFDPIVVVKLIGAGCFAGSLWLVVRAARGREGSAGVGLWAALLAGAAPPLVIWSLSGLENGLTLLLVGALYDTAVRAPPRWSFRCGVIAALLAMTHPGNMVFAGFGVALAAAELARGTRPARQVARELTRQLGGLAVVLGPFLALRLAVFGRLLPHTYYAKRVHLTFADRLVDILDHPGALAAKLAALAAGTFGPPGPVVLALTLVAAAALAWHQRLERAPAIALVLQAVATAGYLWMDDDWMGEHRFGSAAVLLSLVSFALVSHACARWAFPGLRRRSLALVAGGVVALAYAGFFPRIVAFASNPPTPFLDVERSFAAKLDRYADILGVAHGSVLLPDVGATLYRSRLTVYDAAGLCEPEVIRTLKRDTPRWLDHHPEFYDWVFDELRPTFISTHHFWTLVTAFDDDPRFARDYVAIDAYEDAYVRAVFGRRLRSGDFVRRDALSDYALLERLRRRPVPPPRADPLVVRIADALAGEPTQSELLAAGRRAFREENDPQRAATLLARALELAPDDLEAAFERASALDAATRPDEARREWVRVLELAARAGTPHADVARARLNGFRPITPASLVR
jgi:hypothetical protein